MFFCDHPYADFADVTLLNGWHTAAVTRELEIDMMNSSSGGQLAAGPHGSN